MIGHTTSPGDRVFIHDHGATISAATVLSLNERDAALQIGSRVLVKPRHQCFEDLPTAIATRMAQITDEQSLLAKEWVHLAKQLSRLGEPVGSRDTF